MLPSQLKFKDSISSVETSQPNNLYIKCKKTYQRMLIGSCQNEANPKVLWNQSNQDLMQKKRINFLLGATIQRKLRKSSSINCLND